MAKEKAELYQDVLGRLYPDENKEDELNVANITFQVTDACNLQCTYCYQINKSNHKMSFDVAKNLLTFF